MSVTDIENAIRQLSSRDLQQLMSWLAEYRAQLWDQQIEEDLEAGRLNALLREVDRECDEGLAKPI
jgi:hypothetical protein